jgi:hypothetical protein
VESLEKLASVFEKDSIQKKISAFIATKNTAYLKQLQKFLAPSSKNILLTKNIEEKVISNELLEESLKMNILRTFMMPIFKEVSNISIFPLWKSTFSVIPIDSK